jgi:hypothetical protein
MVGKMAGKMADQSRAGKTEERKAGRMVEKTEQPCRLSLNMKKLLSFR